MHQSRSLADLSPRKFNAQSARQNEQILNKLRGIRERASSSATARSDEKVQQGAMGQDVSAFTVNQRSRRLVLTKSVLSFCYASP
jgi:hypothetical protein